MSKLLMHACSHQMRLNSSRLLQALLLPWFMAFAGPACLAAETGWQFTLPSQDGQRFISLSQLRAPVLVNFWGVDCPPCVAELPMLGDFARQHSDWQVVLVNTDGAAPAQRFIESHALTDMAALTLLRPGLNVSGLMRKAGNLHGVLPFSVAVDSSQAICFRKAGALTQQDLAQMRASCR